MPNDLINSLLALSPSELKAVLEKVAPRRKPGPVAPSRAQVHRATREVLMVLTTVDGRPFGNWLLRLTPEELEALKRTPRKRIQTLSLDALPRRGEYVFTKPNGMPYRSARGFTTAGRRAGPSDVRSNVLRHTFATRLCENDVDLRLVQELGG